SMGYFVAFVVGIPIGALVANRFGWRVVFGGLSAAAVIMLSLILATLPAQKAPIYPNRRSGFLDHFAKMDRFAGITAAFLTSGGLVGFLTYVGAWLNTTFQIGVDRIGLLFMASGLAAVAASPLSGWLSDHTGKRNVIIWTNLILALMFVVVARIQ